MPQACVWRDLHSFLRILKGLRLDSERLFMFFYCASAELKDVLMYYSTGRGVLGSTLFRAPEYVVGFSGAGGGGHTKPGPRSP